MPSKRFRGKACAYCCVPGISTVGEHVLARGFVAKILDRDNLPKVPACVACNAAKERIEEYAQVVAVIGGRYPAALANAGRNLEAKARLRPRHMLALTRTVTPALEITPGGLALQTGTVTVDTARMLEFYGYLVRGLYHHHTGGLLPQNAAIRTLAMKPDTEAVFVDGTVRAFGPQVRVAGGDLGSGVLRYQARISEAVPGLSVWRLEFGQLQWVIGNDRPRRMISHLYAATVPPAKVCA